METSIELFANDSLNTALEIGGNAEPFNYSALDITTASELKGHAKKINNSVDVVNSELTAIGETLAKAQLLLANNKNGNFQDWINSETAFSHRTAYKLIGRYNYIVHNMHNINQVESLPTALSYEISKPSANPELVEKTLRGEIETLKQFKIEVERLKAEKQSLQEQVDIFQNAPASVIEKEVIREVVKREQIQVENPQTRELLTQAKNQLSAKERELVQLKNDFSKISYELRDLQGIKRKENEINELSEKIALLKSQQSNIVKSIDDVAAVITFLRRAKEFVSKEFFPIVAFNLENDLSAEFKKDFNQFIGTLENWIFSARQKFKL